MAAQNLNRSRRLHRSTRAKPPVKATVHEAPKTDDSVSQISVKTSYSGSSRSHSAGSAKSESNSPVRKRGKLDMKTYGIKKRVHERPFPCPIPDCDYSVIVVCILLANTMRIHTHHKTVWTVDIFVRHLSPSCSFVHVKTVIQLHFKPFYNYRITWVAVVKLKWSRLGKIELDLRWYPIVMVHYTMMRCEALFTLAVF